MTGQWESSYYSVQHEDTSYTFLRTDTNRYLFTLDSSITLGKMQSNVMEQPFMTSVDMIRKIVDLHGFGFLPLGTINPFTYNATDINFFKLIFQQLNQMLKNRLGVSTPFNFFAFKPQNLKRTIADFITFLQDINGITSIIIILTTTEIKLTQPQPSSAWDIGCLYYYTEPTLRFLLDEEQQRL
ncbi:uncharacterized protein LOC142578470 [Dermacentor variabilis]|uniref:uncharacterized protein LOC142578470 n=1 Tax=Dermacentor variabilis TaxID=34621 RepID=UPI003F5BAC2A